MSRSVNPYLWFMISLSLTVTLQDRNRFLRQSLQDFTRLGPNCNCGHHSISRGQNRFWTQRAAYAVMGLHYVYSSDYHRSLGLLQSGQLMALGFPLEIKLKIVGLCFTERLGSGDLLHLLSLSCHVPFNIYKTRLSLFSPDSDGFSLRCFSVGPRTIPAVKHQEVHTGFGEIKPHGEQGNPSPAF